MSSWTLCIYVVECLDFAAFLQTVLNFVQTVNWYTFELANAFWRDFKGCNFLILLLLSGFLFFCYLYDGSQTQRCDFNAAGGMQIRFFWKRISFRFQIFLVLLPYRCRSVWFILSSLLPTILFSSLFCFPSWYGGAFGFSLPPKYIPLTYTVPIHSSLLLSQWFHIWHLIWL